MVNYLETDDVEKKKIAIFYVNKEHIFLLNKRLFSIINLYIL